MVKNNNQTAHAEEPDAEAMSKQAGAYLDAGRFEDAAALYERLLERAPERVNAWINRGLALWSLQRPQEALACYDRALALAPDSALAWMNRGNALSDLERPADALEAYDRALAIDSSLPRAWYNKGDTLAHQGRFIEAKACFENAQQLFAAQGEPDLAGQSGSLVRRCEEILMNEAYG